MKTDTDNEKREEVAKLNILRIIMFYFPAVAFKRYALSALGELVRAEEVERIWNKTLEKQKVLALKRPRYSLGANHLFRYMEWDCALHIAAQEEGISQSSAKELIEKINWAAFGSVFKFVFYMSRLRSSRLLTRVNWIIDLMFLFIFTKPFERQKHPNTNEITFDVLVCPLANYFKDQNVPELTSSAACSLDYRMANLWGVEFNRAQTIAQGNKLCDFRFYPKPTGKLPIIQP